MAMPTKVAPAEDETQTQLLGEEDDERGPGPEADEQRQISKGQTSYDRASCKKNFSCWLAICEDTLVQRGLSWEFTKRWEISSA